MKYPRVLLVYMSCINKADQHGLTIRNWFADWPKENLAQIYSGADGDGDKYCGYNFKIGIEERRFGKLFLRIKASSMGKSFYPQQLKDKGSRDRVNSPSIILKQISRSLFNTGYWELLFKPILSHQMESWVKEFNPHLIYCQGYDLTFSWLPLMLQKRFNIPIVFQTTDDWPNYLYKKSLLVHPIVIRTASELMKKSSVRFAICDLMSLGYQKQFNTSFETLMVCDNVSRFTSIAPKRVVDVDCISVVYSGNLELGRWESLADLCSAADELNKDGYENNNYRFYTLAPNRSHQYLAKPNKPANQATCIARRTTCLFARSRYSFSARDFQLWPC